MKSQITKLAAAAAVLIIAASAIFIVDELSGQAWAIEDTAEALDRFNAVYIAGTVAQENVLDPNQWTAEAVFLQDKKMPVECWAQANEERTQSQNVRLSMDNGRIVRAVYGMTSYSYDANTHSVVVKPGIDFIIAPWPNSKFMVTLQEAERFQDFELVYGKDGSTGRDRVFVSCVYPALFRSYWIEIDLATKLPVRVKQWHNTRRQGPPALDLNKIVYFEQLPDEIFEFEIPQGAAVVDEP